MLLNSISTTQKQKELIENLEGLGDILVFLTENKRNSEVIPSLKEFGNILNQLFELRETNPEKFEMLMLAEEYWKISQTDKREAQLRLGFAPEKYLITFSFLLNQIIRVFESSIKVENEEVTRHACYELVTFLAKVSEIEKAELFVKEILSKLLELSRKSIEIKSAAAHASTYNWYTDIVFNNLGQKNGFKYDEYLELFNSYFLQNIKFLITNSQFSLFKSMIGFLIDGVHVPTYTVNKLWDYLDLLSAQDMTQYRRLNEEIHITRNISSLTEGVKKLYSSDLLHKWLTQLDDFKNKIYPLLNQTNKDTANKLESEIKSATIQIYANQSLLRLMFVAGAWAIYKKEPNFIKEIWTHKQPDDASASYGGNNIYPQSLLETVEFYFLSPDDDIFFWEDHHDGGIYLDQYFLLLLIKYFKNIQPYATVDPQQPAEKKYPEIEAFQLPFENSSKLSDIKFQAEGLLNVANGLKDSFLLGSLGLAENSDQINELVDDKLIPFLKRLASNAEEKITRIQILQPLSATTIERFKNDVFESFIESATIRKTLALKGMFENKVPENTIVQLPVIGYDELRPRDLFFEERHVDHSDWGKHYGRNLGEAEDSKIVNDILEELPKTTNQSLIEVLSELEITNNTVIFASYDYLYEFLEKTGHFRPYWSETKSKEREANFQGWLVYNEQKIKIYNYHVKNADMYYAVFDTNMVGKLIQHYPLFENDSVSALYKNLRINIKDFSTDEALTLRWLQNPPEWLQTHGNQEQQKLYLSQHVILQVGEKFEFIKAEAPKGLCYFQATT